jgi:hypothetical protein
MGTVKEFDNRLAEALTLLKKSDSVELKLTVPEAKRSAVLTMLDIDILDAELREVLFFDTPELTLNRAGIIVRARRMQKGGDSVIKLRPLDPDTVPNKLRRSKSFTIEIDYVPGAFVCSGSLEARTDNAEIRAVLRGERQPRKLFVSEQRSFFEEHAPKGCDMNDLTPLGPIHVARLKYAAPRLRHRPAVAEMWFYPDGSRVFELSTRCAPNEALSALTDAQAAITEAGLTIRSEQTTKTRKALEYFSRLHRPKRRAA